MCSISDCTAYSSLTTSSFVLKKRKKEKKKRSMFRASFSAPLSLRPVIQTTKGKRKKDEKRWFSFFLSPSLIPPVFVIPSLFVRHSNPLASNGMRQSYHLAHVRFGAGSSSSRTPACRWPCFLHLSRHFHDDDKSLSSTGFSVRRR